MLIYYSIFFRYSYRLNIWGKRWHSIFFLSDWWRYCMGKKSPRWWRRLRTIDPHASPWDSHWQEVAATATDDRVSHLLCSESDTYTDVRSMSRVYFRSERQSLRRMPKTGCICFTIRTYFHPVAEIVSEPGVPGRLAGAIRVSPWLWRSSQNIHYFLLQSWPEPIAQAKGKELFADTMLPWLDNLHQKQIETGVIKAEETFNNYPYWAPLMRGATIPAVGRFLFMCVLQVRHVLYHNLSARSVQFNYELTASRDPSRIPEFFITPSPLPRTWSTWPAIFARICSA